MVGDAGIKYQELVWLTLEDALECGYYCNEGEFVGNIESMLLSPLYTKMWII